MEKLRSAFTGKLYFIFIYPKMNFDLLRLKLESKFSVEDLSNELLFSITNSGMLLLDSVNARRMGGRLLQMGSGAL